MNTLNNRYVYLSFGHKSFATGKIAIVAIHEIHDTIASYVLAAKKEVCKNLGLNENDVCIFDCKFLGENVLFIN